MSKTNPKRKKIEVLNEDAAVMVAAGVRVTDVTAVVMAVDAMVVGAEMTGIVNRTETTTGQGATIRLVETITKEMMVTAVTEDFTTMAVEEDARDLLAATNAMTRVHTEGGAPARMGDLDMRANLSFPDDTDPIFLTCRSSFNQMSTEISSHGLSTHSRQRA